MDDQLPDKLAAMYIHRSSANRDFLDLLSLPLGLHAKIGAGISAGMNAGMNARISAG